MKTVILKSIVFLLFLILGMTGTVRAQMIDSIFSGSRINLSTDEAKALNISAEQLKNMQAADVKNSQEIMQLRGQLMKDAAMLQKEMDLPNPDKNKIKVIADQMNAAQKKLNDAQIEHYFSSRNFFKPNQLEALAKLRADQNKKIEAEMKERVKEIRAKMPAPPKAPQNPPAVNK